MLAHANHEGIDHDALTAWFQWIGQFHPTFLHFPIALLVMGAISEILFIYNKKTIFEEATRVMLVAAAFFTIPTVLTGLAWAYNTNYELFQAILEWHRFTGFTASIFIFATAYAREYVGRGPLYFILLSISTLNVVLTGYLGGYLAFGELKWLPNFNP